jgi:hypothetical protein
MRVAVGEANPSVWLTLPPPSPVDVIEVTF